MSSTRWLIRRLVALVLVVLGAATLGFFALRLMPGDPVRVLMGTTATPEAMVAARHDLGLDRPLIVQYGLFIGRLLRGNLGTSYQLQQPVSDLIGSQIWATLELALTAMVLALATAILLAVATAGRRPFLRRISSAFELVVTSSPGFWVGVVLLTLFSFRLHVFPATGGTGIGALILPSITLALAVVGVFAQVLREGLERAMEEPFALSARARGTSETGVRVRHAFRHAMIPLITLSGLVVGNLLGGAVVVETVFGRQGIGRIAASAISTRDFPVVTGVVVVSALLFSVISILVDGLYRVVDPRLKEERT
ncbi:ABC transporter permease [Streptomyces sp. NPDC002920]